MGQPRISVVVAVVHAEVPAATVAALCRQTLPAAAFEVIVVDALCADDWAVRLPEVVRSTGRELDYSYHVAPRLSRAAANNVGIARARADLLLFDADDFALQPGALAAHLRFHEAHPEPGAVGLGGGFFPPALREDAFSRWLEDSGELLGISFTAGSAAVPPDFFYTANASVKRSLLERAGRFDEDFPDDAWDDYEFGLRLAKHGMRSTFLPDAAAVHDHPHTVEERRRGMRKAGVAAAIFERKYPGPHAWKTPCHVPPWRHAAAGLGARVTHALTGRNEHLWRYYRRTLDADFVRAYRSCAAASGRG